MDMGLANSIAVVTGGNSGLGAAFAQALAEAGAAVAIAARTHARNEQMAQELATLGVRTLAVDVDVTQRAQYESNDPEMAEVSPTELVPPVPVPVPVPPAPPLPVPPVALRKVEKLAVASL